MNTPHRVVSRMCAQSLLVLSCTLLTAGPAATAHASAPPKPAAAKQSSCAKRALAYAEALEPVIEAVTDGLPKSVPAESAKAQTWWTQHRSHYAGQAALDTAMREVKTHSAASHPSLAARSALVGSIAAIEACPEPRSDEERLMLLDLLGMAGWLRAQGVDASFPVEGQTSMQTIGKHLRAKGKTALADQLEKDVAATLQIPVAKSGNLKAANSVLKLVDDAQLALL